jgi:uncharacterized protein YacL
MLAMAVYVLTVVGGAYFVNSQPPGLLRTLVALLPIIPAIFVVLAVVAAIRELDEMYRRIQFEAFAFAYAGMFLLLLFQTLMNRTSFLGPDPGVQILAMAVLWVLGIWLARRRYEG